jgi:hypothetical protein
MDGGFCELGASDHVGNLMQLDVFNILGCTYDNMDNGS